MEKIETIEEFYKRKFDWMPENLKEGLGHFNVFDLEPYVGEMARPIPYKRRDFYKIMLIRSKGRVHYADRIVEVEKQAISFSSPLIPYKWEHLTNNWNGAFCIFNQHFFHQFGNLGQYSVFQPGGDHIFELTDEQFDRLTDIYKRMKDELNSEYLHKYDVLRNLVFELLHFAMKLKPVAEPVGKTSNASQRISTLFMELLERQFPIDDSHLKMQFRTASEFAAQLNVHVNHLNRALRETTSKTTSQLIAERMMQEAKTLLKQSNWNVSEIGWALGFSEVTHFNNFFKKNTGTSPLKFRKS